MNMKLFQEKKRFIHDKIVVGIDPGKEKHQAIALDSLGTPLGRSFTFAHNRHGFSVTLWDKLKKQVPTLESEEIVFAVETSINLWQKLCFFLQQKGFTVLLIAPLATKHERPKMSNNFTKTDPKDALAIANIAREGYFNFYEQYSDHIQAMSRLSITYDKLMYNIRQIKQRIRSQVELLFPEFTSVLNIHSKTARQLLQDYLTAEDFQAINLFSESLNLRQKSRLRSDLQMLSDLKQAAQESIGLPVQNQAYWAERLTMTAWLNLLNCLDEQLKMIREELISLAKQTPYFKSLVSLEGISELLAARFIAETRNLSAFLHAKQLEKLAGLDLQLSDSGQSSFYRRISRIGNRRLRTIVYKMTEETKKHIPEVRIRFLKRQIRQPRYTKDVIAVSANLLKLVMALIKENRTYTFQPDKMKQLHQWELKYNMAQNNRKSVHFKKVS